MSSDETLVETPDGPKAWAVWKKYPSRAAAHCINGKVLLNTIEIRMDGK